MDRTKKAVTFQIYKVLSKYCWNAVDAKGGIIAISFGGTATRTQARAQIDSFESFIRAKDTVTVVI
jgi:hypothetical protein